MESPAGSEWNLVPGLLTILRQAAWLRGALIALGVVLYLALYPGLGALPLLLAIGVERAAFIALVSWDALRKTGRALFAARARLALADVSRRDRARVSHAETRASNVGMKNLEGFQNLPGLFVLVQL